MRRIVLDTNLLFSALRSRNTAFREKLFSDEYTFYSSKYIIVEIFKHKERIFKNAKIADESEVYEYLNEVLQRIQFVNEDFVSITNYTKAYKGALYYICKPGEYDKLKKGLRSKGFNNFLEG